MKKYFSAIFLVAIMCLIVFGVSSASAQSNNNNLQTNKKLALSSWDKTVSWFKKIVQPSKTVVAPPVAVVPKIVPNKPKSVTSSTQKSKTIISKKKNISKTVQKQQNLINKNVVEKKAITTVTNSFVTEKNVVEEFVSPIIDYTAPLSPVVVDVGSLDLERPITVAKGINSSGVVVGYSVKNSRSLSSPFLSKNGNIKNIGGGYYGTANAINDNNQVVGQILGSGTSEGGGKSQAFIWENDKITKIGKSPGIANDINNKKQVVGFMWIGQYEGYPVHSFIWEKGNTKDLGTLGGDDRGGATTANAINDEGQVVGCSIAKDGLQHPFLWENGKMKDLGNLYNEGGCAVDINNSGQVVGYFYKKDDNPKYRIIEAFLWEKDGLTALTDAPKNFWPYKINNLGDVVGAYNGLTIRKNGVYSSYLELSGWSLDVNDGVGFNDNRQVAASGNRAENNFKYGLMISLPDNMPAIQAKVQNIIKIEPVEEPRDPNTAYPVMVPAPAPIF